jgi:hypothetical protein
MLNALLKDIEQFAYVTQDLREIHIKSVKNVRLAFIRQQRVRFYRQINCNYLAGCKSDDECLLTQACIQRECQDPCPFEQCGRKATCTTRVHRARCQCPPGHKGSPYVECKPYECLNDPECHDTLACRNEKCVDPCQCAANADCEAKRHKGICTCKPGYRGDAYLNGCELSKNYFL